MLKTVGFLSTIDAVAGAANTIYIPPREGL